MNNFKKIGLSALAGSLVATSAFAGSMSVAGGASVSLEHINGGAASAGKSFSMGNQLTFSGSGELDNGLNVALSFVLDQNDDKAADDQSTAGNYNAGSPFDSHSVTISSDAMGSLKFSGEGGSSAVTALDGTAAGDIWDAFDDSGAITPTGVGGGDNSMMYTLPSMMDGLAMNVGFTPSGTSTESATSYGLTYTGVEGLSVSYGHGDGTTANTDGTAMKASYAMGSFTVAVSNYEYDADGTSADNDTSSYNLSYTVTDEMSISYGQDTIEEGTGSDVEATRLKVSYTTGGMTISAAMAEIENMDGTTTATEDRELWSLGASFAPH
jgi:outer membrane protein OmpU